GKGLSLPVPEHMVVTPSPLSTRRSADEDAMELEREIKELKSRYDIVVVDTPGTFNHLSDTGHRNADILITPVNDSLVDLDVIAALDVRADNPDAPSQYAANVMDVDRQRLRKGEPPLAWFVLRNRISHIDAKNKREVDVILRRLSESMGFRYISGMGERVVYREMFMKGLTILDLMKLGTEEITVSHIAAKNEIQVILNEIGITV
ncbi:MAG: division plane positioning ATPase MipZ, partial [Rickettsiales bacterium]|nr:division plane positioning ATPase MipZ [Rickettsiales bacterium]